MLEKATHSVESGGMLYDNEDRKKYILWNSIIWNDTLKILQWVGEKK